MWTRLAIHRVSKLLEQFPAVLILGARQVGKTTLARLARPDFAYCDLEQPHVREAFTRQPAFEIEQAERGGLILDEAQFVPEVFAALRGIIDAKRRRNGRFLLLGSAQPALVRQISESLAGRVGLVELDALTVHEVGGGKPKRGWRDVWLRGGFPGALSGDHREWWEAYLRTYAERDLPHLGVSADPLLLRRLLTMLAHQQGGLLNASQFGGSLGVSYHTVQRYLDVLEQTFLVRRLPPYFRNVGKRLTKSPKVYLRDTGLLHHLLNISSAADLDHHPVRGASWETFVLEDVLRRLRVLSPYTQSFFWRTATGNEADLVLENGSHHAVIEIKAGSGTDLDAAQKLAKCAADIGAPKAWIISQAPGVQQLMPGIERRGFEACIDWLPAVCLGGANKS